MAFEHIYVLFVMRLVWGRHCTPKWLRVIRYKRNLCHNDFPFDLGLSWICFMPNLIWVDVWTKATKEIWFLKIKTRATKEWIKNASSTWARNAWRSFTKSIAKFSTVRRVFPLVSSVWGQRSWAHLEIRYVTNPRFNPIRSSSLPSARSSSKATFLCLHCRPWPFLHGHQRVFPRAGWFNSSHLAGARSRNGRRNVIQGTRLNPHKLAVHRLPREVDWCRSPSLRWA